MPNADRPQVLICDDGELDDVRSLLRGMGVDFAEADDLAAFGQTVKLAISSARRAIASKRASTVDVFALADLSIVVIEPGTRSVQGILQQLGCALVVRRPVHPTALRLLVQRALYDGDERRRFKRVAIGAPVKIGSGIFTRNAVMSELSLRGCGLLSTQKLATGDVLKVTLPKQLTGNGDVTLEGRVLGNPDTDRGGSRKEKTYALAFTRLRVSDQKVLQKVMSVRAVGMTADGGAMKASSNAKTQTQETPAADPVPEPVGGNGKPGRRDERRASGRREYPQSILARSGESTHALLGCDLSVGGMRVEWDPALKIGMELKLALYGNAGIKPTILRATVVRGDEETGWGLQFAQLTAGEEARLGKLVQSLPTQGSATGAPGFERPGVLVTEVLSEKSG
jgi:hypothetical protein